ncbi:MAG TPA: hypothetical protein VMU89_20195 [Thermomicrobiaceae bacterium]|nr:hypothetical protein [Thermomicrobiaceae bacterium]
MVSPDGLRRSAMRTPAIGTISIVSPDSVLRISGMPGTTPPLCIARRNPAADGLGGAFPDGVVWVDLAPLGSADLVLPAVARAVGVPDAGRQRRSTACRRGWAPGASGWCWTTSSTWHVVVALEVTTLPWACPRLAARVTRRTALRVRGERELAVPPCCITSPRP